MERADVKEGWKHTRILSCGEKHERIVKRYPDLKFRGTFYGIGFGGSLVCLSRLCSPELQAAHLLYPDPYIYLLSRVVLSAILSAQSEVDFLMSLADEDRFLSLYRAVLADESGSEELTQTSPPNSIMHLRTSLFTGKTGALSGDELRMIGTRARSDGERKELEEWCHRFIATRAFEPLSLFLKSFNQLQRLARKISMYCADPFDPAVIERLLGPGKIGAHGAMIYLSDYASSSLTAGSHESAPYTRELFDSLAESTNPIFFAYSHASGLGQLLMDPVPPEASALARPHYGTDATAISEHERFHYLDSPEARKMVEVMFEMLRKSGHRRILDVGCRLGLITDYIDESYSYYGFDIVPDVINAARSRLAESKPGSTFRFEVGDWNSPPEFDADVVIFGGVFFYIASFNRSKSAGDNAIRNKFFDYYLERYRPAQVILQDLKDTHLDSVKNRFQHETVQLKLDIRHPERQIIDFKIR